MSWNQARAFCQWLSGNTGLHYTLPSEAQWEFACRAGGSEQPDSGGYESDVGRYSWYRSNSGRVIHPVKLDQPNAWGLCGMHGNVWEWCQDWYHPDYKGAPADGRPWEDPPGPSRLLRGGSWRYNPLLDRSTARSFDAPDNAYALYGFRVARNP